MGENVLVVAVVINRDWQEWVDSDIHARHCDVLFSIVQKRL